MGVRHYLRGTRSPSGGGTRRDLYTFVRTAEAPDILPGERAEPTPAAPCAQSLRHYVMCAIPPGARDMVVPEQGSNVRSGHRGLPKVGGERGLGKSGERYQRSEERDRGRTSGANGLAARIWTRRCSREAVIGEQPSIAFVLLD